MKHKITINAGNDNVQVFHIHARSIDRFIAKIREHAADLQLTCIVTVESERRGLLDTILIA